jgi:indole-3-acetate monooxygenase
MSDVIRSPERDTLLATVERVRAVALAGADEAERLRTLPEATVSALRASGLFTIGAPRALGGAECDPLTQVEVFEAMTRIDTSAGWCLLIGAMSTALAGAYLGDRAVARIFEGARGGSGGLTAPHAAWPICAGLLSPAGVAERVPGGYRVSGRWGWGSGIRHSSWVFTCAVVAAPGAPPAPPANGPPEMISLAVPTRQVTIEDTWHVAGLKGTGSCHYSMAEVFVEDDYICPFPLAPARRGGPLYRLPIIALLTPAHVGFALGVARRALDEIAVVARSKVRLWSQAPLLHHQPFQMDLGRAQAKLGAARALAFEALGSAWATMVRGGALSTEQWSAIRLASTYVTEIAAEVTAMAYHHGGGGALYASSPLQRCFRDIHAATQHVAATDDAHEFAGKVLLGIAEPHPMMAPRPEPLPRGRPAYYAAGDAIS